MNRILAEFRLKGSAGSDATTSPEGIPPGEELAEVIVARLASVGYGVTKVDLHEDYGWNWVCSSKNITLFMLLAATETKWLLDVGVKRSLKQRFRWSDEDRRALVPMLREVHDILAAFASELAWHDAETYLSGDTSRGAAEPPAQ